MKRSKIQIARMLLAVYLPMLLLASFHVHHPACCNESTQQTSSSMVWQEEDCLLCQFLQMPCEESPQILATVVLPVIVVEAVDLDDCIVTTFSTPYSSRAPPVLL